MSARHTWLSFSRRRCTRPAPSPGRGQAPRRRIRAGPYLAGEAAALYWWGLAAGGRYACPL